MIENIWPGVAMGPLHINHGATSRDGNEVHADPRQWSPTHATGPVTDRFLTSSGSNAIRTFPSVLP